jgi:hypothetical protein
VAAEDQCGDQNECDDRAAATAALRSRPLSLRKHELPRSVATKRHASSIECNQPRAAEAPLQLACVCDHRLVRNFWLSEDESEEKKRALRVAAETILASAASRNTALAIASWADGLSGGGPLKVIEAADKAWR